MDLDRRTHESFRKSQTKITEIPCLAHYNSDYPNIITTDASTKGRGATLWQEQPDGKLKPIRLASRFLSDTEKIRDKRARNTSCENKLEIYIYIYIYICTTASRRSVR